jgi:hypothetical protein
VPDVPQPAPLQAPATKRRRTASQPDEDTAPAAPILADGFGNPHDTARPPEDVNAPTQMPVAGRHVRLFTRVVSNASNVASPVVRGAIDHSSWQYTRCYASEMARVNAVTDGTVTVSFDVLNQLPRHAKLESSTFTSSLMNDCFMRTLTGQTVNAAGPDGAGHVVYGFRFVVTD